MFKCSVCGHTVNDWMYRCSTCGADNTFQRNDTFNGGIEFTKYPYGPVKFHRLNELKPRRVKRYQTGFKALDSALGGGLVHGSRVMLSGDPGIGKSTLLLQVAAVVQDSIYCAGEEPLEQIRQRAARLQVAPQATIYLSDETGVETFLAAVRVFSPCPVLIVVDSIQAMRSVTQDSRPGSPWQVAACAQQLADFAKVENVALLFACQNDKGGDFAGPAALEHLVDVHVSFQLDDDDHGITGRRCLSTHKNRYGPSGMTFPLRMSATGLLDVN